MQFKSVKDIKKHLEANGINASEADISARLESEGFEVSGLDESLVMAMFGSASITPPANGAIATTQPQPKSVGRSRKKSTLAPKVEESYGTEVNHQVSDIGITARELVKGEIEQVLVTADNASAIIHEARMRLPELIATRLNEMGGLDSAGFLGSTSSAYEKVNSELNDLRSLIV